MTGPPGTEIVGGSLGRWWRRDGGGAVRGGGACGAGAGASGGSLLGGCSSEGVLDDGLSVVVLGVVLVMVVVVGVVVVVRVGAGPPAPRPDKSIRPKTISAIKATTSRAHANSTARLRYQGVGGRGSPSAGLSGG